MDALGGGSRSRWRARPRSGRRRRVRATWTTRRRLAPEPPERRPRRMDLWTPRPEAARWRLVRPPRQGRRLRWRLRLRLGRCCGGRSVRGGAGPGRMRRPPWRVRKAGWNAEARSLSAGCGGSTADAPEAAAGGRRGRGPRRRALGSIGSRLCGARRRGAKPAICAGAIADAPASAVEAAEVAKAGDATAAAFGGVEAIPAPRCPGAVAPGAEIAGV